MQMTRQQNSSALSGLKVFAKARPRIDVDKPDYELVGAPCPEALEKWNPGIQASTEAPAANVIQVFDVIGEDWWTGGGVTSKSVARQLKAIGNKDVEVQINSPGGDMFEGISIYNLLVDHPGEVTIKIMGLAGSAASIIAMAGDTVQMGLGSFLFLHNAWVVAIGNRHDMLDVAQYLEPFDLALRDIYIDRTKKSEEEVSGWMDAKPDGTFFTAKQAIDVGLADGIMSDSEVIENKDAKAQTKAVMAIRKVESVLTHKGGMSRSAARSLITEMKGGKPDAATTDKPGAVDNSWAEAALAFAQSLKQH